MSKTFNFSNILSGVEKALDAVKVLAPIAGKFNAVANVATIVIAAEQVISNAIDRAKDAKEVISSQDQGKIDAMIAELQRVNDELNKRVEAS